MMRRADLTMDRQIVYDIVNRAYVVEVGNTGEAFNTTNRYGYIDVNSEEFGQILEHFYVYEEDSVVLGCVKLTVENNVVDIGPLAVEPNHQGKGIASKLMTFAETLAPVQTLSVISCRTSLFGFYEKRGYKEISRTLLSLSVDKREILTRSDLDYVHFERKDGI